MKFLTCLAAAGAAALSAAESIPWTSFPIVDEVAIASADPGHRFTELPQQASRLGKQAGVDCRILPNDGAARTFAVRLGEGKGLEGLATYVLEIDYAEDAPRNFYILNRGDDTMRGIACGATHPDSLYQYTQVNPEVLDLPLSGTVQTWRSVFRLHQRTKDISAERGAHNLPIQTADGFWVLISQPDQARFPASQGAAIAGIRLRRIEDPAALDLTLVRPPADLPQRHLFWREEMSDGIISHEDASKRGMDEPLDWYDAKLATMRYLGYDTFCKDLLEFGHNQGWDSAPYGGNDWVYQTKDPGRWERIVDLCAKHDVPILPYYEYVGSVGQHSLGKEKRAKPLNGKADYTHIGWTEKANADLTDPDTLADFRKVVDCTVLKLKDRAEFLGVWLRPRPAANPIGFGPTTIARYNDETGSTVTLEQLRGDAALREGYYDWWFGKRRDFLTGVRDTLRGEGLSDAAVFYTTEPGEPTRSFHQDAVVVQGDIEVWKRLLAGPGHEKSKRPIMSFEQAVADHAYLKTITAFASTWGDWEWQHACPTADPQRYQDIDGVMLTYPYNRSYTVADPAAMEAFRAKAGLTMIRHQSLNENTIEPKEMIGYHCIDMELSGPACVLQEVQAVANGDPRWMGLLAGVSLTKGFPEYVRAFNANFLALPAIPSTLVDTGLPGVVVRAYDGGKHGTWYAVCNTTMKPVAKAELKLPGSGKVAVVIGGKDLKAVGGTVVLDLPAASLITLHRK